MVEVSIRSIQLEQLLVTALLYYLPFIHHVDTIRHLDRRKAMTDQVRLQSRIDIRITDPGRVVSASL